tara:strand:- start:396 stop:599 length:204 start_codon:yes stop_codon:yes gene_type:complete
MKVFILVISLWGFNGDAWIYTGNQLVLQQKFDELSECEQLGRKFLKFDMNKYFTFKVQCVEDIRKDI